MFLTLQSELTSFYLPYLNGERTPHLDPDCRGVFFGLSSMHTRADMVRSVYEGMIYSLTDCKDVLVDMGVAINEMMACGGGLKSPVKRQMLADSFGVQVKSVTAKEGPALGVAILAGVGAGLYPSVEEACKKMIHTDPDSICNPDMSNNKEYAKYHEVYKELYSDLKFTYKKMASL